MSACNHSKLSKTEATKGGCCVICQGEQITRYRLKLSKANEARKVMMEALGACRGLLADFERDQRTRDPFKPPPFTVGVFAEIVSTNDALDAALAFDREIGE